MAKDTIARLCAWVESAGGARRAAELVKCSESMMRKLCAGERRPGIDVAFAIEDATSALDGGPILAASWKETASPEGSLNATGTDG